MIKIYDKLWYVEGVEKEDNLSYMCQYVEDKNGQPMKNIASMQKTGRAWAVWYKSKTITPKEAVIDNIPLEGFFVGDSVCRWSTSNKLFRVKDSRGFTVEIPTGNLATLLHHCVVDKGVVQEKCVWGREGTNHILLPVNSKPYLDTLKKMDIVENKLIPIKDLKPGDWVKMFEDDREYCYIGKIKTTWKARAKEIKYSYGWSNQAATTRESAIFEIQDTKWMPTFFYQYDHQKAKNEWYVDQPSKAKIVKIIRNRPIEVTLKMLSDLRIPERCINTNEELKTYDTWDVRSNSELISFEVK